MFQCRLTALNDDAAAVKGSDLTYAEGITCHPCAGGVEISMVTCESADAMWGSGSNQRRHLMPLQFTCSFACYSDWLVREVGEGVRQPG